MQLDREGADECEKLVVCDGPATEPFNEICSWPHVVKPDGPSGTRGIMWWTFQQALDRGADRLIYCEDDLRVSRDAVKKIRQCTLDDRHSYITFYDYKEFPVGIWKPGLNSIKGLGKGDVGMWGSLCLLLPRRTLEWALQHSATGWGDPWLPTKNRADCVLSWAMMHSPWPRFYVYEPSLVDHVGEESSIEPRPNQKARFFLDDVRRDTELDVVSGAKDAHRC
jgi:hypothetical protein